jgi:ABC-2 type transport system permease protein
MRSERDAEPATSAPTTQATDAEAPRNPFAGGLVTVNTIDLMREGNQQKSLLSAFYAAGTAVLFLLFSATGAGSSLLEEKENGALERLLTSNLTMGQLLFGKWLFIALMGTLQIFVMFVWGALVFGVELWDPHNFAGFAIMTAATAAAASGFGLVFATACRSRAQLSGVSTIVILIMSAVGGSMFPRFLMPDWMQQVGLVTFNAWALDGYRKVFWYDRPLTELWPQVAVLMGLTVVFMAAARVLARRWEAA